MPKNKQIRVPYASAVYGREEIKAVNKVLSNPQKIVAGPYVKAFEKKIAKKFGQNFGVMVNSGSSANLIAFEVLNLPKGSEVITPCLTFSTTLAPIIQTGLVPVLVDVEEGTYLANIDQIEAAITRQTKALMIPSLLGNIPNLVRLKKLANKHNLAIIEDSCDTLGATYKGKPTGHYSNISTTSFYASHIITALGGNGMVCLKDKKLARQALIMSHWGRQSTLFGSHEKSEDLKRRFAGRIGGKVYDAKFIFSEIGYNFQATDIAAAFGLQQLKKLNKFTVLRRKHFTELLNFFKDYEDLFILPKQLKEVKTNWLAFPLTIKKGAKFKRYQLVRYLEEQNIQTRPIFTGNVLRQPAFRKIKNKKLRQGGYPVTDNIMRNGLLVGCHHGLKRSQLNHVKSVFKNFLDKYE